CGFELHPALPRLSAEPAVAAVCVARSTLHPRYFPAVAPGRSQSARPTLHGYAVQAYVTELPSLPRQFQRHQTKTRRPLPARRHDYALSAAGPQRVRSRLGRTRHARNASVTAGGAWNRGAEEKPCRGGTNRKCIARTRIPGGNTGYRRPPRLG